MTKKPSKKNDEFLSLVKKRFQSCEDAERENREAALEDMRFAAGDQWPDAILKSRKEEGRPHLTINRVPQFCRQIENDIRQNKPAIKISPVDDKADVDTAQIFQGIIRHIEYSSNADTAYDRAIAPAIRGNFGFIRIATEYCDERSFDQEIRIKSVRNPFSCYLDPASCEPDGSDASFGFQFEDLTVDEFKALYPDCEISKAKDWQTLVDQNEGWISEEKVRVAEYFEKEFEEKTLIQLADGSAVFEEEIEQALASGVGIVLDESGQPKTRKTKTHKVKWYKICGEEILEKTDWPSKYIPIVPVYGEELDIAGKVIRAGVVTHAKDSQRVYNYMKSYEAEAIALAPRAPWIGDARSFEGHEMKWALANKKPQAFLPYNHVDGAPPPTRNSFEPAIGAITQAAMLASDDMKATTGIYDAALGNRSNENSGIAIQRRNIQAQTSNFHFVDNLSKSIRHVGRILVDLIQNVYDTERVIRTLGEDGSEEIVKINGLFEKNGEMKAYNLGVGKYDVTVSSGPSFETKRQEAVASMLELSRTVPQFGQVAPDLMVKAMDFPYAQEIAERMKKILPPGIADSKDQKEIPPELQAQLGQMDQMIGQLTEALNKAQDAKEMKREEYDHKERMLAMELETRSAIELAKLQSLEAVELLNQQIRELDARTKQQALYLQNDLQAQQEMMAASQIPPQENQTEPSFPQEEMAPQDFENPTGGLPGQFVE